MDIQDNSLNNMQNRNNDLNSTFDDLENERKRTQEELENMDNSNLFKSRIIETEINSSLFLQQLLYFNFFYDFLAFTLQLSSHVYRIYIYDVKAAKTGTIVLGIWFFQEFARIYFGYTGNIRESLYHMFIFILTSLIFSSLLQVFFIISENDRMFPTDIIIIVSILVFNVLEVIWSIWVIFSISVKQTEMYYLRNSQITSINKTQRIKTSKEIEQELFERFPSLNPNYVPGMNIDKKNN